MKAARPSAEAAGVLERVKGSLAKRAGYAALDSLCALQRFALMGRAAGGERMEDRQDLKVSGQRSRGARKGGPSEPLCDRATARTRDVSPRQLPTDHDHDGEPRARSANIRVINRRVATWTVARSPSPLRQRAASG